jgi:capsular exopolysaccharide synthesis family protein
VDLRDYVRVAAKRWWMVLTGLLAALGIATLITVQTIPQYATSVTFFITTPNNGVADAYQGGLFSQQRVKSYESVLTGDRLAELIAARTEWGLDAAQIRERISAQAIPDTVLLKATVTDGSRDRSKLVAATLATQFKGLVESLETPPDRPTSSVKVEVVGGPETENRPVSPRPLRNLAFASLLGLIVGVGAAVTRELLDMTVKAPESLQALASAPVLAGVPFDPNVKSGPPTVARASHSAWAEALRQLRTNLQYVDVDNPVKTLVVTSAVPGEGKSTTACGLAMLFAKAGQRVLIVDADLRHPRIADYLGLDGSRGLTTALIGKASVDDVLQRWSKHLWVLPSGAVPPNPSELLGSQYMAHLLTELKGKFDTIIVDSPPLLPVTDAAVIAAQADGALLVTQSGKTTSAQVTAAVKALRSVDARLLGAVLNMVAPKGPDAYYYYSGYSSLGRNGSGHAQHGAGRGAGTSLPDMIAEDDEEVAGSDPAGRVGSVR